MPELILRASWSDGGDPATFPGNGVKYFTILTAFHNVYLASSVLSAFLRVPSS